MARRLLFAVPMALATAAFLVSVAFFKQVDSDSFWHIKAGQVMWETGGLIKTDPFAYTREGLPYLATHEWMAQLLFAAAYGLGGSSGIVIFRILCTLLLAAVLLAIDRKNLWPNALLVMAAAIVMRPGLLERPQIVSNILFALTLLIGFRLLDPSDEESPDVLGAKNRGTCHGELVESMTRPTEARVPLRQAQGDTLQGKHLRWGLGLVGIQILWVNLHGAEAILTFLVPAALFCQALADGLREGTLPWQRLRFAVLLGLLLLAAMFISPNLHHNITYLWLLLTDKTATFIKEWSPRDWPQYLALHGTFLGIAATTLLFTRHRAVGVALLLLAPTVLSRLGSRHEILFTIAALSCTFYELKHHDRWQEMLRTLRQRWVAGVLASVVAISAILWFDASYRDFVWRSNLRGLGSFEPAGGATDFLIANGLDRERIYNTYAIGGYLLFRGIPVFVDGRNVDYGYDHLNEALAARHRPAVFRQLEERYGFTVAVIEFGWTNRLEREFTYLREDPLWALTYVDDWTAVYLKRTPKHEELIARMEYRLLTPHALREGTVVDTVPPAQWPELQRELLRMIEGDSQGISALMAMGQLAALNGQFEPALTAFREAIRRAPGRFEPYVLAAGAQASRGEWAEAAPLYEEAIARTRYLPVELNYGLVADAFERAGDERKAVQYRKLQAQ